MIAPLLISFAISAAAGPKIIGILRRLKAGQTVRDDGPQTHLKKNGTPTMGEMCIRDRYYKCISGKKWRIVVLKW